MPMEYVQKALDTVVGANFERQDLSKTITLLDGPPRPISQYAPSVKAKGKIHYWDEQNLIKAGSGAASYAEGSRPTADAVAPTRPTNPVAHIGKVAEVTDTEAAVWTGAGAYQLAEGELERLYQEAIDYQTYLKTLEVLNEIEYMHLAGDHTNPQSFAGGQFDGLLKWVLASGNVSSHSGSSSTSTATLTETFIRDLAKQIAVNFPTLQPDTLITPPELRETINTFVGGGAGRPIVQIAAADVSGLVGGNEVAIYQTGYSAVDVRTEPWLSPTYNTHLPAAAIILYPKSMVRHCPLIDLAAEPLARIGTSISRMITCVATQEHRLPGATGILNNLAV